MIEANENVQVIRLERSNDMPRFVEEENRSQHRYRYHFSLSVDADEYLMRYRRSRWVELLEGSPEVLFRKVFARILFDGQFVGALEFQEYRIDRRSDPDKILYIFDAESSEEAALSAVLCSGWNNPAQDISRHGNILNFQFVWMAVPHARSAVWAYGAQILMEEEFPNYSLLLLKAFPLEYEAKVPDGSALGPILEARQRAMIRHYSRLLDVTKFPGKFGEEGWMFQINPAFDNVIAKPNRTDEHPI